jgi:hypothetical protein
MSRTHQTLKTITIAVLAILYVAVALWVQTNVNPRFPSDIGIYLDAGDKTFEHENPYQPFKIGASFVYPPPALLLFSPLSMLPRGTAELVWAAFNGLVYLCSLAILRFSMRPAMKAHRFVWFTAVALLFAPFLETLTIGQEDCLILLGLAAFIWGLADDRRKWVGDSGLAVAISLKMSPVIFLAIPVVRKDWGRCARILSVVMGLSALSVLFFGIEPWLDFIEVLPRVLRGYPGTINETITPTVRWLLTRARPDMHVSRWLGRGFSMAVLGIWIGAVSLLRSRKGPLAMASLGVVTMTISSSLIWYHHLVFLTIPLTYLILRYNAGQRAWVPIVGWAALGLIQLDRLVEFGLGMPPLLAILGYLLIYAASLAVVLDARRQGLEYQTIS